METGDCHRTAVIHICISVGGLSEQYVDLKDRISQDTSAVNAWKASGKPGHPFDVGGEPKTPRGGYCSEFPDHRVSPCSEEALGAEQPEFQRRELRVSLQPARLKVPVLLCNLCVWQTAYVISID